MRIAAFLMSVVTAASLAAQSGKRYRITHSYVLGGDGSWDYVVPDPPNHRLFIGRQNRVMSSTKPPAPCSRSTATGRCCLTPGRARPLTDAIG